MTRPCTSSQAVAARPGMQVMAVQWCHCIFGGVTLHIPSNAASLHISVGC